VDDLPGIGFEKLVAALQARLDPASKVTHNEKLLDRLGHSRQFDVVIRGQFAAQPMLGVIECKDLKKRVGTPEVDAFVTKAQEVNANFKILASRRGFSKAAVEKCRHYGIHPLSLTARDSVNTEFFIGTRWEGRIFRWENLQVTLFVPEEKDALNFKVEDLRIDGRLVINWFKNYLLNLRPEPDHDGWSAGVSFRFDSPQLVDLGGQRQCACAAVSFRADRIMDRRQRLVGLSAEGFYNWSSGLATFPPEEEIHTEGVPADISKWEPWNPRLRSPTDFLEVRLEISLRQFLHDPTAIELGQL